MELLGKTYGFGLAGSMLVPVIQINAKASRSR